jgi:long-chain acyl-CoA synthetase
MNSRSLPPLPPDMPLSIRALIDARALQYPDKPFLLATQDDNAPADKAAVLTFGQLRDDCRALEAQFHETGRVAGDVVSVFMSNGIQTARLLLAAMYSGMIANPLNLLCQPSQLSYVIEHSDTNLIFSAPDTEESIQDALAALRATGCTREIVVVRAEPTALALPVWARPRATLAETAGHSAFAAGLAADAGADCEANREPNAAAERALEPKGTDNALLMYTSGTTGAPKGVLLTHSNLLANARNVSAEHRLGTEDRVLASLPLYHINGLVVTLLAPLFHGGSVVMPARFSARAFWRDAAHYGCTWINVVPTIIAFLINSDETCAFDLSALKFCRSASAALPAEHHRAFEARFGIGVIETMGMTETAAPAFSNPFEPAARRVGSIGLPSGCDARVIAQDGHVCAPNECGELVLRGEQVMSGYYKRLEETRTAFTEDGWLRTGDLGYRDSDGYFYINGRAKELIIKGGENISPREIDEALLKHPAVLDAAAVGVPDPAYGQEIVAFVVPRVSADVVDAADAEKLADELRRHCLIELGRYKTPKEFRFVTELPRGPSGKVQRLKLLQT